MERVCIEVMSDDRVLERVVSLVTRSNQTTAELLVYLAAVEERGLHRREACSSLFAFCVERLHMSESATAKRIWAARIARKFPLVLDMIARGEIHLTAVTLLGPHLTEENHAGLLGRAKHRSKREIERLVAEMAPRPDAPSRVVALPRPPAAAIAAASHPMAASPTAATALLPPAAPRPSVVAPLSPRRYQIRVTVDEDTHARLVQLQDLLAQGGGAPDPAVIIARALDVLLAQTLASKAAVTEKPRGGKEPTARSRYIPARVRQAVWNRDAGRCAFVDGEGRRCSSTRFIEFHHVDNWARGGEHRTERIELRCRTHNQYQAELDYGAAFMAERRRARVSRAKEPSRSYGPAQHSPANPLRGTGKHSIENVSPSARPSRRVQVPPPGVGTRPVPTGERETRPSRYRHRTPRCRGTRRPASATRSR